MARIQIELSEEKAKELEDLMRKSGTKTKKDLFNKALSLYGWYLRETKDEGHTVAAIDEKRKRYKEIVMP